MNSLLRIILCPPPNHLSPELFLGLMTIVFSVFLPLVRPYRPEMKTRYFIGSFYAFLLSFILTWIVVIIFPNLIRSVYPHISINYTNAIPLIFIAIFVVMMWVLFRHILILTYRNLLSKFNLLKYWQNKAMKYPELQTINENERVKILKYKLQQIMGMFQAVFLPHRNDSFQSVMSDIGKHFSNIDEYKSRVQ